MMKKWTAGLLCLLTALALMTGCVKKPPEQKIAMVTDSMAVSDNHLNQSVWRGGLLKLEEDYNADVNFYRPQNYDEEEYMTGVKTLVEAGYNVIVLGGRVFTDTLLRACETWPDVTFIGVDSEVETVPSNAVVAVFDKAEAGFLAGAAAAMELGDVRFGGVAGQNAAPDEELLSGFLQGAAYAGVTPDRADFVAVGDPLNFPLGQQATARLVESGVQCLLVSSDPTGLGAAAELRVRASMGADVRMVGCEADYWNTASYYVDDEQRSPVVTSAWCSYGEAVRQIVVDLIEGDEPLGRFRLFDVNSGAVGLPEENPNLSQETLEKCEALLEQLKSGEIVVAAETNK